MKSAPQKDNFIIIDGNSLVNRSYYALPVMTVNGKPVHAVYGFATMLITMIKTYSPKYIAVAFDLPQPTFRHKMYSGYKAKRTGMPDDLAVQMPILKNMLRDMGIAIIEKEGYEADDIIGTMAKNTDCFTYIVTGDRDSFQLIDGTTTVIMTKRGITEVLELDENSLKSEYGLTPKQIIDYKSIAGDTSDSIPGVPGIGDKGAHTLLEQYGSLDGVYENLENVGATLRRKLESGRESAYMSQKLATIDTDVPVDISVADCPCRFPFGIKTRAFFVEHGFKSLLKKEEIFEPLTQEHETLEQAESCEKPTVREIVGLDALNKLLNEVGAETAFDFGENSLGLCVKSGEECRIRFAARLDEYMYPSLSDCIAKLKPMLEDENITKAVYDAKRLKAELIRYGVSLKGCWDVKLARYVDDVLKVNEPFAELCKDEGKDPEFPACAILSLKKELSESMRQSGTESVFHDLEMPLVDVLFDMERIGFKLDKARLAALGKEYTAQERALEKEIFALCGTEFNVKSPKQLAKVLFEDMNLPYPTKSKTYSTGAEILEQIADLHPVVDKILEYRTVTKLNSTYVVGLDKMTDADGTVHTDFRQTVAATGRLSSAEPNLQNIPVRDERGKRLRAMFASRDGYTLVSADYSQIELRLLAHFSGDDVLKEAYDEGSDVHAYTAAKVFGVPLGEVTPQMRRTAKAVNFGIIYGISDFGLARNVKMSRQEAKHYIDEYFEHFPSIKSYLDESVRRAREAGYAETLMGRRRRVPELYASQYQTRKFGERVAMNMPLQGSAADIIKRAMIDVHAYLSGMKSRLILQIHDELIVEAADDEIEEVKHILKECMENAARLSVPLTVDIGSGKYWIDC